MFLANHATNRSFNPDDAFTDEHEGSYEGLSRTMPASMPIRRSKLNLSRCGLPLENVSISTVIALSISTCPTGIGTGSSLARQTDTDIPRLT